MLRERLRELRGKRSQQEISDLIGISRVRYAQYEAGKAQPPNDMLERLADFYQVSTDYLLGRTNEPKLIEKNPKFKDFSERFKKAMERKKVTAEELCEIFFVTEEGMKEYLSGERLPSVYFLSDMATFLGVTVDWLLGNTEVVLSKDLQVLDKKHIDIQAIKKAITERELTYDGKILSKRDQDIIRRVIFAAIDMGEPIYGHDKKID